MTSLHKPAMFNLVHILTGMRRSGKTFQLFQLITEYKKRWASAHADAHLECPYSSAEHGRNLSSQVLAQALQASEGNRLADTDNLHETLNKALVEEGGYKPRLAFGPVRVAMSGRRQMRQ